MSGIVGKNLGRGSGIVTATPVGADAVSGSNIADDAIDSEHYADGSIDNAHIADDAIDSEHYVDGSIDAAHIASNAVTTVKINADAVTGAKIADDALDSEHYTDGSIDNAHLAANSVDSDNYVDGSIDNAHIADDAIDSEHYATGSIDTAHIATNQIDETLMKDAFVGDFTDATVTASDYFLHGDATDSGNTKKDTIQGILDLTSGVADVKFGVSLTTAVSNVTGDGTVYNMTGSGFWTEIFDTGSDFNTTNGTFTAPSTGKYLMCVEVTMSGHNSNNTLNDLDMVSSNRTYRMEWGDMSDIHSANELITKCITQIVDMDSSDTVYLRLTCGASGGKGVDITTGFGGATKFQGALLA
tara:strand:+ start:32 stop:1102 length:1071 start_codon:yes stop_codon:yes gene_type:complete